MHVLVVGSGGRESAIVSALKKSPQNPVIACVPGNAGITALGAYCFSDVKATDLEGVLSVAREFKADFCIIGPDDPLVLGLTDILEENGFKTFGPRKNAAVIEGSKSFSKNLMTSFSIPTAMYKTFTNARYAIEYIREQNVPIVIKADGLALGKGVIIAKTYSEAEMAVKDCLLGGKFGDSGKKIVIEEFLTGPEISVLCLTDGKDFLCFPSSTDHKRAFDGDTGPNTGGMGVISPAPYYTEDIEKETIEEIIKPTIAAMKVSGRVFKGCLYFGLMITSNGVKVIEYNCRFGDPEAQAVLPLLEDGVDFLELLQSIRNENLSDFVSRQKSGIFKNQSSVCVVLASRGYPGEYKTGFEISGIENFLSCPPYIHYNFSGIALSGGKPITCGGRVMSVTAVANSLTEAKNNAYSELSKVKFENCYFRSDIGKKAIEWTSD